MDYVYALLQDLRRLMKSLKVTHQFKDDEHAVVVLSQLILNFDKVSTATTFDRLQRTVKTVA